MLYSYPSANDQNAVDYMSFSDEMESIFTTKGLEKTPVAEPEQFIPPAQGTPFLLSAPEEQIIDRVLHMLTEKVDL